MNEGMLTQGEINALLANENIDSGNGNSSSISEIEIDMLGEIGNITMGSASTTLSNIVGQKVNITTPRVSIVKVKELKDQFAVPQVTLNVGFTEGVVGGNLLAISVRDAAIIANFMMGGDGSIDGIAELSEIEESAVCEAMNQMIGTSATSLATMLGRNVNITPPKLSQWVESGDVEIYGYNDDVELVRTSFRLTIGDVVDSSIMQLLPMDTVKEMISMMLGDSTQGEAVSDISAAQVAPTQEVTQNAPVHQAPTVPPVQNTGYQQQPMQEIYPREINNPNVQYSMPNQGMNNQVVHQTTEVNKATFEDLHTPQQRAVGNNNIDLLMDVPLDISVILGRAKMNIKDVLNLGTGSIIELDKYAEEPVEIVVNGKKVAYGEVVVVDENFGVRITSIVSNEERIKSLGE